MNNKSKYDFATAVDIEELNNLISMVNADKTHEHTYCRLVEDDFNQSHSKLIFVTRADKQITCFLSLHCKYSFEIDNEGVFEVFAHPNLKGQGYGSTLIDQAEEYAINETNIKKLEIAVLNTNPNAKKLYIRKGYISSGKVRKGEYFFKKLKD